MFTAVHKRRTDFMLCTKVLLRFEIKHLPNSRRMLWKRQYIPFESIMRRALCQKIYRLKIICVSKHVKSCRIVSVMFPISIKFHCSQNSTERAQMYAFELECDQQLTHVKCVHHGCSKYKKGCLYENEDVIFIFIVCITAKSLNASTIWLWTSTYFYGSS